MLCFETKLIVLSDNNGGAKCHTNYSDGNKPGGVVGEPGEVETKLFAVILFDKINGLHLIHKVPSQHSQHQFHSMVFPGCFNPVTLGCVHIKVVADSASLVQVIQVEFFVKRFLNDGLDLATVELIELVRSKTLEG